MAIYQRVAGKIRNYGVQVADRVLLRKKIMLRKIKNLISEIEGIRILEFEEQYMLDKNILQNIGYFNSTKSPDSMIWYLSKEGEIVDWIIDVMDTEIASFYYLLVSDSLAKIQVKDCKKAVRDLWNKINPRSKGFILMSEDKRTMYEIGTDSRDESHILYDIYCLG